MAASRVLLRFRPCDAKYGIELELCPGEHLLDAIDERELPVPFGCRAGTCGTCRIHVEEGMDALEPPDERERFQLGRLLGANLRLACRVKVRRSEED
ncbi:MAG: 2Fe-2S iron-sulfur cluster-binding protein [Polyangiaceae bacterium]